MQISSFFKRPEGDGKKKLLNFSKPLYLERNFDQFLKITIDIQQQSYLGSTTLSVTSSRPAEGKTTIASNMTMAIARNMAKKILLVDACGKNNGVLKFFGLKKGISGIFDVIDQKKSIEDVIIEHPKHKLHIMPAGTLPKYPIAYFEKVIFQDILNELENIYDIIIFDTPAVVSSPETPYIASFMDGTLLVVEAEKTRWEVARHSKDILNEAGARLLGAFLNKKQMFIPGFIYKRLL